MSCTGTIAFSLNTAVVVANDPMPRVSKNAVTKPSPVCSAVGATRPPLTTVTMLMTRATASPRKRRLLASIDGVCHQLVGIGSGKIDRRAADLLHRSREQRPHRGRAFLVHATVGRKHRHRALQ